MPTVRKTFHFDAAHKIPHHEGKCRNLHGHTYTVTIEAAGDLQTGGSEAGMVIDFGRIKALYREHVHADCDHKYLNDVFGFATTAEMLATEFLRRLTIVEPMIVAVEVQEGVGNVARAEA